MSSPTGSRWHAKSARPALYRHGRCIALALMVLAGLAGCGATRVSVPATFPAPLVDKLPLHVGVRLDEALTSYKLHDKPEQGTEIEIEVGAAQTALFSTLLNGMFTQSSVVSEAAAGVDAVLVPSIQELQFSTPEITKTDYFEVWIRYRMQLYRPDNTLIAEWPLTAYGQANARNYSMQGDQPALQAAALAACRDAMTFFIVQFRTIPAVEAWLRDPTAAAGAPPA